MTALVADFGSRAFWLGSVCTFAYLLLLGALVVLWWLYRDADKPTPGEPPLTKAEPKVFRDAREAARKVR